MILSLICVSGLTLQPEIPQLVIPQSKSVQSKTIEGTVYFNEGKAGTYTLTESPTSIQSKVDAKLATTTLFNTIEIELDKETVKSVNYQYKVTTGTTVANDFKFKYAPGKLTIEQPDGKPQELQVTVPWPFWTNLNPGYFKYVLNTMDFSKPGPQKVNKMMLDSLRVIDLSISKGEKLSKQVSGKMTEVQMYRLSGSVSADLAVATDGTVLGMNVPSQKLKFIVNGAEPVFADPLTTFPELSQPTSTSKTEIGVSIPLSDGTLTKADIIRPSSDGKFPVILTRTPYGRAASATFAETYSSRGYIFISQDVRGTGESKGAWDPFVNEQQDGYDTIDWISKQPWCDGNIGMIGASYVGYVQWAAASKQHPALKCIVPQVSPPASAMWNLPYENGVFTLLNNLWWLRLVDNPKGINMNTALDPVKGLKQSTKLPLSNIDDAMLGFNSKIYESWLTRNGSAKWKGWDFESQLGKIKIPALHISGWFDGDGIGTQRNWEQVARGGNKNQWLIYGPWTHFFNTTDKLGEIDFGSKSLLDLDSLYLRWFDTWLKHKKVGFDSVPKVKYFTMGSNQWNTSTQWPPIASKSETWYFQTTKGELSLTNKSASPFTKTYTYDPASETADTDEIPVGKAGSVFIKESDLPKKMLLFKSKTLTSPLTISGAIEVEFDFKSSAKNTDFYVTALDIDENGKMFPFVIYGKMRASYLTGLDKPRPITPGKTYRAKFRTWDTSHQLKKGHRLGILLTSSLFPATSRNLGTVDPLNTATKIVPQTNTVFGTSKSPALIRLHTIQ